MIGIHVYTINNDYYILHPKIQVPWCFYLQINLRVNIEQTLTLLQTTTMKIVTKLAN